MVGSYRLQYVYFHGEGGGICILAHGRGPTNKTPCPAFEFSYFDWMNVIGVMSHPLHYVNYIIAPENNVNSENRFMQG